jgi:hypothetical protein
MLDKALDDVEQRWAIAEDRVIELEQETELLRSQVIKLTADLVTYKSENGETLLLNVELDEKSKDKISATTWLGDTGASCHLTNSDEGMYDVQMIKSPVKIGSGKSMTATKIGKKRMTVIQKDGSTQDIILTEVKYVPELWVNLFSIGKALQNGFDIGNKGIKIFLVKGNTRIVFDRIMPTSKGFVVGIEMLPTTQGQGNVAIVAMDKGKKVNVNDLHVLLSHVAEDTARKTAKFYGWDVFGTFTPCDHCATSKARQKNLNKSVESRSLVAGEQLCIDISSVKGLSYGNRKFWLLIVDDCVDQCWSEFLAKKSDTTKVMLMLIKDLKA